LFLAAKASMMFNAFGAAIIVILSLTASLLSASRRDIQ
jgi:hypothetical protein